MKKSVILVVVVGIMLVLSTLAIVALSLMTSESRIAEHKIRRTRAYYASQAGIVDGLEQLRRGSQPLPTAGNPTTYLLGSTVNGYEPRIIIVLRGDNPVVNGRNYICAATSPSPYCVFSTIDNYAN